MRHLLADLKQGSLGILAPSLVLATARTSAANRLRLLDGQGKVIGQLPAAKQSWLNVHHKRVFGG
jgi:hypothetical protein